MNPKLLLVALVPITAATIAGVLLLSDGDEGGNDTAIGSPTVAASPSPEPTPPADASATAAPSSTTVSSGTMPEALRDFALQPTTEHVDFFKGSSDAVPEGQGVYVFDIETKQVEGWHASDDEPYSGLFFFLAPDNRLARIDDMSGIRLLADRESRMVYELPEGANPVAFGTGNLAAADSRVLMRFATPDDEGTEDWFAVVDVGAGAAVVSSFQADAWSGLISRDGERVVLAGDQVWILDAASGDEIAVLDWKDEADWPAVAPFCLDYLEELRQRAGIDAEVVFFEIQNTLDESAFLVMASSGCPQSDNPAAWLHYTWDGDLLASGAFRISPAPNGDIAWVESTDASLEPGLPIAHAVDLTNGLPVYRVVGASAGEAPPVVLLPREGADRVWAAATLDAGIHRLAADGSISVSPAPDNSGMYARRYFDISLVAFDAVGNELGGYAPDPGASFQGVTYGMDPWGDSPTEMRFVAGPRGSDDCCPSWSLIVPYVEEPPYEGEPIVLLRDDAVGAEIRDAAGSGNVIGTLSTPSARVLGSLEIVDPSTDRLHCEFLARYADFEPDCAVASPDFARYAGLWLHVMTDDGIEGWILVRAGTVGL